MRSKFVRIAGVLALLGAGPGCNLDELAEELEGLNLPERDMTAPETTTATPEQAQQVAQDVRIEGAQNVTGAPPAATDAPETPQLERRDERVYATGDGRVSLEFDAQLFEGGGELQGVYVQVDGADFYWDIPIANAKQARPAGNERLELDIELPDFEAGLEVCFEYCVYTSDDLVSEPARTCVLVPAPDPRDEMALDTFCGQVVECSLDGAANCDEEIRPSIARTRYEAPQCNLLMDAALSCAASLTDCDDVQKVFDGPEDDRDRDEYPEPPRDGTGSDDWYPDDVCEDPANFDGPPPEDAFLCGAPRPDDGGEPRPEPGDDPRPDDGEPPRDPEPDADEGIQPPPEDPNGEGARDKQDASGPCAMEFEEMEACLDDAFGDRDDDRGDSGRGSDGYHPDDEYPDGEPYPDDYPGERPEDYPYDEPHPDDRHHDDHPDEPHPDEPRPDGPPPERPEDDKPPADECVDEDCPDSGAA